MRIINKEPEAHLIELLTTLQDKLPGWQAVVFGFSKLLEHYRSEYQIKIAMNLLNDLLGDRDGAIYLCEDSTIFVVVKNLQKQLMDKMVFQLRYLFMDDPLAYTPEGDENPEFAEIYDLESRWQEMLNLAKRRLVQRVRRTQAGADALPAQPGDKIKKTLAANSYFDAGSLAGIEHDIRAMNIAPVVRRQPVCAAIAGANVRTVFDEMYINIAHMRELLHIQVDILSNRWLFKYLTQVLDDKMFDLLQKQSAHYLASPISINVNVPTLLSSRFTEFDAAIKPAAKVSVVMELQVADVFSDMSAFLTAKDVVQKLGYRVCLDGVTDLSFPHIDRQRLGFDLIKVHWNADTDKDVNSPRNKQMIEAIKRCGANRVILTRCDNEHAVAYGQMLGLSLFQGRYLDGIVNPKSTVKN
jgi:EAL domain-containing protein (putative c-di-GMP-specific phosphodiesterase class I)